jgi:hypothetical protein
MKGLELFEKYPAAANVIKEWFLKSMIESFKDESVPEEFKQFMLEQGIEEEKVGTLIDVNPRMLFDVFDENDISINIIRTNNSNEEWDWELIPGPQENSVCKSRKEAELFAIEAAFEILENKLSPKEEE